MDDLTGAVNRHDKDIDRIIGSIDSLTYTQSQHDKDISKLVISVGNLVDTQKESNKRLEVITEHLANSAIASSKLEQMEREITDSFRQRDRERNETNKVFGEKIEAIEHIQRSDAGCQSVKLLAKDVSSMNREHILVMSTLKEHKDKLSNMDKHFTNMVSPATIKWIGGFIIMYSIAFGSYVVSSFSAMDKITVRMEQSLQRDIKDTARLTKLIYEKRE